MRVPTAFLLLLAPLPALAGVDLALVGEWTTGTFDLGGAEIAAFDPDTARLFVVNGATGTIDVLDLADPTAPVQVGAIDVLQWGGGANSVAVHDGVVAVAIEADPKTDPGLVAFFDTDGAWLGGVEAGALPDMVTFSPNGRYVLTANEGEPSDDYLVDPEGSVTIVDLSHGPIAATARTVDFKAFAGANLDASVRVYGPGATAAEDFEPEYVAVSHDSRTAWVTLQENNALAVVDLKTATVTDVVGLGFKDHTMPGKGLDASDMDAAIAVEGWPVRGMYLPDAVAAFRADGRTWLVTANEGDSRAYGAFDEEARVGSLPLDPTAFPTAAALKVKPALGRLKVTSTLGDEDGDGDYDALYAFGARSIAVWDDAGALVWEGGDALERHVAAAWPAAFNAGNDDNAFDSRSDDKGPEPEGLDVGKVAGRTYAFVGLERTGGIVVYDVTDPTSPDLVAWENPRDLAGDPTLGTAGHLGPEGVLFVPAEESPTGVPLLVVSNEISGSVAIFEVRATR